MRQVIIDKFTAILSWVALSLITVGVILFSIMNGRFGNRVLKQPYRNIWRILCWAAFVYGFFMLVCVPLFRWWDGVVAFLNHVIWG